MLDGKARFTCFLSLELNHNNHHYDDQRDDDGFSSLTFSLGGLDSEVQPKPQTISQRNSDLVISPPPPSPLCPEILKNYHDAGTTVNACGTCINPPPPIMHNFCAKKSVTSPNLTYL